MPSIKGEDNSFIAMLVDPRPYTYEYRKPRYSNPTFQSSNLYGSLYHRDPTQSNDYFQKVPSKYEQRDRMLRISESQDVRAINRNYSEPKRSQYEPMQERNPERYDSGYKLPAIGRAVENARPPQTNEPFMSRSQLVADRRQGFERFRIYERQQKPYNIISCYPKEQDNNKLRNFPKLTLENQLIERGSYHSFKSQKF